MASFSDYLARANRSDDVEIVVQDVSNWVPNETGIKVDKEVSRKLKPLAQSFDLVHAMGYRCAWACAEAIGSKHPWVYTAWDFPKTTHRLLIDRLNESEAGMCVSHELQRELDSNDLYRLSWAPPFAPDPPEDIDHLDARKRLGVPEHAKLVAVTGRWVPERNLADVLDAMPRVWEEHSDAFLLLAGDGKLAETFNTSASYAVKPDRIKVVQGTIDPYEIYSACDLLVVPSHRAATSLTAIEAMSCGTAVLMRRSGGLPELALDGISATYYGEDQDLGEQIATTLGASLTLESLRRASVSRWRESLHPDTNAETVLHVYRKVLE